MWSRRGSRRLEERWDDPPAYFIPIANKGGGGGGPGMTPPLSRKLPVIVPSFCPWWGYLISGGDHHVGRGTPAKIRSIPIRSSGSILPVPLSSSPGRVFANM
ncbi:hypothetical protein LIA77_07606 [Sarocladium implicatum]|nr:hypothetical protein LIA77_07606 [Sarocladium implicatum]